MRRHLVMAAVCFIFFILPLQVFIIGDYTGIGIQGAVYRFQISGYGTYFFPITREIIFVLNGTLTGKTALSVLLWVTGSVMLTITTFYSFLHVRETAENYFRYVTYGLVGSCIAFLGSCIAQYGFFFQGPAGISLPAGIIAILSWIVIFHYYHRLFPGESKE